MYAGISGSSQTRRNDERKKPAAVPGACRAIAIGTTGFALGDAICKGGDIGITNAGPKRTRALGVKARGPQVPGFCDRQPRRVNLSGFKARQLDEKGRPKATF